MQIATCIPALGELNPKNQITFHGLQDAKKYEYLGNDLYHFVVPASQDLVDR